VQSAFGDSDPASPNARFIQALAANALETVRLTEVLSISPEDEAARATLEDHLSALERSAGELGFVHLEAAVAEARRELRRESFGPSSLIAVRVLAWRYEALAAMPSQSGTHPLVREPQRSAERSLRGRHVLVADDEADVRWFYVGVLREAGARVIEARDGVQALELAREAPPDLILADIVMPRLDGLALCAAVRREPVLDGVPIVLLSWHDDFLHRLRELGADAQGYLRKEVPAREVLERVFSVLEPLTQVEDSLESAREARGDLEEIGVSTLLRATRRLCPNARIILQDPWSLFEVELCEGRIVDATRTGIDGAVTHGAAAFPPLVGMSSGRFIVAAQAERAEAEGRESLEASFADATRRVGLLMRTLAANPDCRVELDQDVLSAYLRHSPIGVQRLVARLVAGEPIQALWESGGGSRSLVDALLVTLCRQGAVRDVTMAASASRESVTSGSPWGLVRELTGPEIQQNSPSVTDRIEREHVREQLAVAMHHEPANEASRSSYPIWRLNAGPGAGNTESISGFEMELHTTPRILGLGFLLLFSGTVGFLIWHQLFPGRTPTGFSSASPALTSPAAPEREAHEQQVGSQAPASVPPEAPWRIELSAFTGSLRPGVDPSLELGEGQGALELIGPHEVSVEIDGVDRGGLPVTLALDQGIHRVRYHVGPRSTDRFYYVKSGATRAATTPVQVGGLVDPR
jgi:CheY-like chemotaxis protein